MLLGGGYFRVYFNISAHMYKMFVRWWFDIVVDIDKLFTYDIYLVIYPMSCLPVSKIFTNERAGHSRSYVNLSVW